jgi:LPXTG-motif cell wall-anchored protein
MYLLGQRSASNLGGLGYRPNQAVQRIYRPGLGDPIDVQVDPTLLFAGLGVLALAAVLFTRKKVRRFRRSLARRRKRRKLEQRFSSLGSL